MRLNYCWKEEEFEYELTEEEVKEIYSLVKKDILENAEGNILEEKLSYLVNEYDIDLDGLTLEEVDSDEILLEIANFLIDNGDYDEIAKEMCEDNAYELYLENCNYRKDPYGYYGISRSDFF